jgi:hypothetical protein
MLQCSISARLCYNFLPFISYITVKRCSCSDLPTGARILILISSAWGEVFSVQLYYTCIVVDAESAGWQQSGTRSPRDYLNAEASAALRGMIPPGVCRAVRCQKRPRPGHGTREKRCAVATTTPRAGAASALRVSGDEHALTQEDVSSIRRAEQVHARRRRAWVIRRARRGLGAEETVRAEQTKWASSSSDGERTGRGDERGRRARGGRRAGPRRASAEREDPVVPVAEVRGRAPMARPRDR